MPAKKKDWSLLANWLGYRVRGTFPIGAETCEQNGRMCSFDGRVDGIRQHKYLGRCLQINEDPDDKQDILVRVTDITHRLHGKTWVNTKLPRVGYRKAMNSYIRGMKIMLLDGTELLDSAQLQKRKRGYFLVEGTYAREDR